jgi:uncharacterized membrane protein YdcZ (DUF606 family)
VFYSDISLICGITVLELWKLVQGGNASHIIPLHPVFDLSGGVLGVIVLLKMPSLSQTPDSSKLGG